MKTVSRNFIFAMVALLITPLVLADVPQSIAELGDRDWQVRRAAAESLGESRSTDKQAIAALTTALRDPDSRVRRSAADALGEIGEKAYRSIPQLVAVFDDVDPSVVGAAARATGRMGRRASRAVKDLTDLLDHEDARVREAASVSLGNLGRRARKSAHDLNARLGDSDPAVRAAAARSLGQVDSGSDQSVTDLVRILDDENDVVRDAASEALVGIGKPTVPALVRALGNGDPIFLQAVVDTLGRIGPVAVAALVETLQADSEPEIVRGYAAMALAQIADRDKNVVPALIEALQDENAGVRMSTAEALGHAGQGATAAVPGLISRVTDPREEILVREFAISALAKIDPGNAEVEDALVYAISDGNARIYEAAVEALMKVRAWRDGAPDVNAEVARLILELDRGSVAAAESLGLIGDEAEAAVPSLIRALEGGDTQLRDAALVALERIGPQRQTIPALVQAMRSGDLASRGAAAARLEAFAKSRVEVWKPLLHQSDAPVLRNWLARQEALYGFAPDEELLEARGEGPRQAGYFDVMGGRAAIRESMQLELIDDPVTGLAGYRNIDIDSINALRVESHPFDKMLEDSDEPVRRVALADFVPDDRFFAWFRDVAAFESVLDGGAEQFMRFESSLSVKSVEYKLADQYMRRLGISGSMLDQLLKLAAIEDFAIVAPDLFFIDGTDLAIVATLASPSMTSAVLELLGLDVPSDGIVSTRTTADGDKVYWTILGDVLLLASSESEINRMLTLQPRRDRGSLGNSSEFLYMQQQLTIGDDTQAYLYFSDAFIRRLVSPAVKIAQLRRIEARAEMEILVAGAMLYLLDGHRNVPGKQQLIDRGYAPRFLEERDYTISEDLIVSSAEYGTIANLKPLESDAVTRVSERESKAYGEFVRNYTRYWRQFFDPIAVRLDEVGEGEYEIQSFILPLLNSRVYNEVNDALVTERTGQELAIPSVTPAPSMMLSMNANDDLRVSLSQSLADMLVEYTSVDPEIFDSIGSGIHLAVQDSTPIVALGGGDVWGAVSKEMLNLQGFDSFLPFVASIATQPSTIMIELAEPDKVQKFLSEAVVKRAEVGGSGELHKVQDREAWIYTLNIADIVQVHLRLEIQGDYLLISNLPWTTAVTIGDALVTQLNGAQLTLDLSRIEKQLPALHTKVFTDYRTAAVDGMGYLYPLIEAGVADSVQQAIDRHFQIYGFKPVHPSRGEWMWRDSYLQSTEFGTAVQPVQPAYDEGDRSFGLFPEIDRIGVNMQLEDSGLRAIISWSRE
jgi:HEAT repeat protein